MADQKKTQHASRAHRTRGKIKRVSTDRPRLSVYRSSKNISAQIIDDKQGKTLAAASSLEKEFGKGSDKDAAAKIGKLIANIARGPFDIFEAEPLVRVEIEDHSFRRFHRIRTRDPAMELDGPHLHALQQAAHVVDEQIVLMSAVLLADRHMVHAVAEPAAIVLLKETLARAPLRAAHQADRATGGEGQHDGRDGFVVIGQFALRLTAIGKDDAVAARNLDGAVGRPL